MRRNRLCVAAAAVLAAAGTAAASEVIISNMDATPGLGTAFGASTSTQFKAFGFTMAGESFDLAEATLYLEFEDPDTTPVVSIWSGASAPASELIVLESPSPPQVDGEIAFTPSSAFELEAGETYWVHLRHETPTMGPRFRWDGTADGVMPTGDHAAAVGFNFNGNPSSFFNRVAVTGVDDVPCIADWNGDGVVNINDFFAYLSDFEAGDPRADLTGSGTVNINDFFVYLNEFEKGC